MPRYFFHLYNDIVSMDEEGSECASLEAAHARALRDARHIAAAEVLEGHLNVGHRIDIADGAGTVLASVRFADAVKVKLEPGMNGAARSGA